MAYGTSRDEVYLADDYEALTVTDSAVGTTWAKSKGAYKAFVTAEDQEMRCRWDGEDPTKTEGHIIDDGDSLELYGNRNVVNFKAIRTGDNNGKLKITYYGH